MDKETEYTYKKYECDWCYAVVDAPCTNTPCHAVLIPQSTDEGDLLWDDEETEE